MDYMDLKKKNSLPLLFIAWIFLGLFAFSPNVQAQKIYSVIVGGDRDKAYTTISSAVSTLTAIAPFKDGKVHIHFMEGHDPAKGIYSFPKEKTTWTEFFNYFGSDFLKNEKEKKNSPLRLFQGFKETTPLNFQPSSREALFKTLDEVKEEVETGDLVLLLLHVHGSQEGDLSLDKETPGYRFIPQAHKDTETFHVKELKEKTDALIEQGAKVLVVTNSCFGGQTHALAKGLEDRCLVLSRSNQEKSVALYISSGDPFIPEVLENLSRGKSMNEAFDEALVASVGLCKHVTKDEGITYAPECNDGSTSFASWIKETLMKYHAHEESEGNCGKVQPILESNLSSLVEEMTIHSPEDEREVQRQQSLQTLQGEIEKAQNDLEVKAYGKDLFSRRLRQLALEKRLVEKANHQDLEEYFKQKTFYKSSLATFGFLPEELD